MNYPVLDKHSAFFNLEDAIKESGCPICRLQKKWTDSFIETILYESVNDKFFRSKLAKTEGFCATHSHVMGQFTNSLGLAILFRDQLKHKLDMLGEKKIDKLKGLEECLLCQNEKGAESRYLSILAAAHDDAKFMTSFYESDGLCFNHLSSIMKLLPGKAKKDYLAFHKKLYSDILAEIDIFTDKLDYRNRGAVISESEKQSWRKALDFSAKLDRII